MKITDQFQTRQITEQFQLPSGFNIDNVIGFLFMAPTPEFAQLPYIRIFMSDGSIIEGTFPDLTSCKSSFDFLLTQFNSTISKGRK